MPVVLLAYGPPHPQSHLWRGPGGLSLQSLNQKTDSSGDTLPVCLHRVRVVCVCHQPGWTAEWALDYVLTVALVLKYRASDSLSGRVRSLTVVHPTTRHRWAAARLRLHPSQLAAHWHGRDASGSRPLWGAPSLVLLALFGSRVPRTRRGEVGDRTACQ